MQGDEIDSVENFPVFHVEHAHMRGRSVGCSTWNIGFDDLGFAAKEEDSLIGAGYGKRRGPGDLIEFGYKRWG